MKKKRERLDAIKEIILKSRISNQDELLGPLQSRGFDITQATLSRDLKQLKIAKVPDSDGKYIYVLPKTDSIGNAIQYPTDDGGLQNDLGGFVSINFSQNIAVIKTTPGFAGSIAYDIDFGHSPEIFGHYCRRRHHYGSSARRHHTQKSLRHPCPLYSCSASLLKTISYDKNRHHRRKRHANG